MASSDDDEDLKLALALSMQHSPANTSTNKTVVDLTSDDEGEDSDKELKQAIALSLQEAIQPMTGAAPATTDQQLSSVDTTSLAELTAQNVLTSALPSKSTPFVIDRKAMEAERLQRLAERKRKRTASPDRPQKQTLKATESVIAGRSTSFPSQPDSVLQFPDGTIKRTYAAGYPRTDDITIDEVLQAPTVRIAVISSFQWDAEWMSRKLSHLKVKQHWVMNVRDAETQARYRRDLAASGTPNLRMHFPPMNPAVGIAHSKYMLLVGEQKMRVVVSTANMEPVYWGEMVNNWQPGVLENTVFLIDLPRRPDGAVGSVEDLPPFGQELVRFLEAQQLDPLIIKGVLKFDFSRTAHLAFVHSIGIPSDTASHPTGLPSLAKAIQTLSLSQPAHIQLDYATSSLGALSPTFLQRIHSAARGLPFTPQTPTAPTPHAPRNLRIHYPTAATIAASTGGPRCAGVVSLRKAHYASPSFPAACLRDHVSTRRGIISHNKLLFARGRREDGQPFAWVYVGSANASEAAWGAQKVLKNGQLGKLVVRNWECGVVVAVPGGRLAGLGLGEGEAPPMSVFEGTVEVPFRCPGETYEGRMPWLQDS
ncbi:hypothetical protein G6514_001434 [Epicoccum nigrum]|nr:hypothetical protein G6514_001434 [Epicoccum nigrum]